MIVNGPIGVFDSGYGGLTVLKEIEKGLPDYDYLYLGDNARAPYGNRSFETVYEYTLQAVKWFYSQGCPLVILACNTASAKALRTIQQHDLPGIDEQFRVLGVIRPTTEIIGHFSKTGSVGILGTTGTVLSESYPVEIKNFFPALKVFQEACPMWVPLIENNEHQDGGADYFIRKHLDHILAQSPAIDTLLLACTHYPLLMEKIQTFLPQGIQVWAQGTIVAQSLVDYLYRHPQMEKNISKQGRRIFYTTDSRSDFEQHASVFYGQEIKVSHISIP